MNTSKDKGKFIATIREHKKILYKVVYSYCFDPEDRKDLEQEIIIQLWRSWHTYDSRYKFSTWMFRIALNVAITHYRKDMKRSKSKVPLKDSILMIAEDGDSGGEMAYKTELLYRFINQLDEFNKAIIILHLEENSYKEIAEILGISESNVGTKINRIKKKLKENFNQVSQ